MSEEQKDWFERLSEKRNNTATTLMNDFAVGNIWNSVIEKYSDQAHFIYELLQNADDVQATKSSFELTREGLFFKHNGIKHFWVSNPSTEKEDQKKNRLGDINAITAVAQSNKKDHTTIGKFGVGFKAVFQYTESPNIYDPNFCFKIDSFIVPVKIENGLKDRKANETVFYFPFDKKEMPPDSAYSDILGKLKNLIYPTLFLTNLQEVSWKTESESGTYLKSKKEKTEYDDFICEKIELLQEIGSNTSNEKVLLFTRYIENQPHPYSIGYFLDEWGKKLIPKPIPAFCFFPTKEVTNLNFILHAPFLLTDSREGIKKGQTNGWNEDLITKLAQLAADSLLILRDLKLIDDNIIKIIPYKETDFYTKSPYYPYSSSPKFFAPFFNKIKDKLQTDEILPSLNGEYINSKNAYWATAPTLPQLFSNKQLALLYENKNAKWIFRSLGYWNVQGTDKELANYISDLSDNPYVAPNTILGKIDIKFTKNQEFEWLHKLYEYLSENKSYQDTVKTKPIFKDNNGDAAYAFNYDTSSKKHELVLFLPEQTEPEKSYYKTIHPDLLENEKSREFIENFGIKHPSLKDEIYNHILPLYNNDGEIDTETHFKKFFNFWKVEGRSEDFINLIKDKDFVSYKTKQDETTYRGKANTIYYPSTDLEDYFNPKPDTRFVVLEDYHEYIEEKDRQILKEFLLKIGVSELPRIILRKITDADEKINLKLEPSTYGFNDRNDTSDKIIDGCSEVLNNIDNKKSILLWEFLGRLQHRVNNYWGNGYSFFLNDELKGEHKYFYRTSHTRTFESTELSRLKTKKWLLSINHEFVAPYEITIIELSNGYSKNRELIDLLGFKSEITLEQEKEIFVKNLSYEEFLELKKWKENQDAKKQPQPEDISIKGFNEGLEWLEKVKKEFTPKPKQEPTEPNNQENTTNSTQPELNFDEDEELAKGIDALKRQMEIKNQRSKLIAKISGLKRYSYAWFETFLNLLNTYAEKQSTTQQKTVSFQEIKSYKTDNRYFLLRGASTYVSPEIEDATDIKLKLVFRNRENRPIIVEGVSKKGQDLLIYCPNPLSQQLILRFPDIMSIEINFTPVVDLIERLYKAFINRNYLDEWEDIQDTMPALNYIYGPPGTGKTTTLCNNINEILQENADVKFLILTPTNKASDVLCSKLLSINPNIKAVRLGRATDPELEEEHIYRDSLGENDIASINVVASTIHRLPYFDIENYGLLFQFQWDYVIFDESSMAGLHYIVFAIMALYKTNPETEFIVAGDPKQIPPVIEVNDAELENFEFQDENIYRMMRLESFDAAKQKIRESIDTIKNLDTQYRSVPQIGQLFSDLSYSKLLKHDRERNRKNSKPLPEKFKQMISENVTFIDIPLNQDNTIYRVKKLLYSSYQTYVAILVAEIIKYFDQVNNGEEEWTIGLIAPYKAQAILLNKLITSYGISENVKVFSDTVHGFQGDECDIVFFVCNPNNYYYSGHAKCLLSKEYIYNVAISRAKDYLVILHPYTKINNNIYVETIKQSYNENFGKFQIKESDEIEKMLLGDEKFIENNAYTTGHDNVNVFGLSEMKYFIKANENAIDIQLRDLKETTITTISATTTPAKAQKREVFIPTEIPNVDGVKIVGKIDLSKFEKYKKK